MSNPHFFPAKRNSNPKSNRRRPQGVSRRQRKKQLGFETLEDRRVMSAESPLAQLQGAVAESVGVSVTSYSSDTTEGLLQILQSEIAWQSLQHPSNTAVEVASRAIPSDPLLANQWHLINTGQEVGSPDFQTIFAIPGEDINVAPVWDQGIFGDGVVVGVFEPEGFFETTHPDLLGNVDPELSFTADGAFTIVSAHATAVTGLIGAVGDNNLGGTGVAPGVTLVPLGGAGLSSITNAAAFRFAADNGLDIVNNSWGPSDAIRSLGPISAEEVLAIRDAVRDGRDGNGTIFVFASGNGAGADFDEGFADLGVWDTAAYDGYVSSRYTIGVTGVDHDGFYNNFDGTITSYPEVSSSVFVAAPTGSVFLNIGDDLGIGSGIVTTDVTGDEGFNSEGSLADRDFLDDTDYTSRFNGTSASAPIASGVIALMLEANPDLSWRDVQEILIRSARQNAEFDVPSTLGLGSTQNTWIQNQMPVFHDPDIFDPAIDPVLQTLFPTLDPTLSAGGNALHYQPTPIVLTNGAGFTVSQGVGPGAENIGYAHGVVDAELAVALAQQWTTKNQALPAERTFTSFVTPTEGPDFNIPALEVGSSQNVPGGIGGSGGFIDYWNEYFVDEPDFTQDFAPRGGFLEFSVPDNNTMTVESLDVRLSISGMNSEFMNHARVLLVSPQGTHSELNQFWVEANPDADVLLQNFSPATLLGNDQGSVDPDTGNFVWTFTTNRNWGERSDDAILFDPTTNEPAGGTPLTQGWRLFIENYDRNESFAIAGLEIAWHGSPIAQTGTQRIQGLVGVDDGGADGVGARDDNFEFSRVIPASFNLDGDLNTLRFREVANFVDGSHESMGANVTVFAHRDDNLNGILDATDTLVDQFITGADGNYYFDVVPGQYIISVEDAAGRTALDDTLTQPGFLKNFQSQWLVTSDFFKVWDYDANFEVPLSPATDAPFSFSGSAIPYHVNHINFLLDPGAPVPQEVNFSGFVFADTNGDGVFNDNDVAVPGVGVFGDVNRNGSLDGGEILTTTDNTGRYDLTVPSTAANVINVGVRPPANWTFSNPSEGFKAFFTEPGVTITGEDFFIEPPSVSTPGDGSLASGIILGTVFNDSNQDQIRQDTEVGIPNQTVYIDMNNSGAIDAGDVVTTTNSNGAYAFADLLDGNHIVRLEFEPESILSQTFPLFDLPQVAAVISGGTAVNTNFGVTNGSPDGTGGAGAILDFGDLPDVYGTRLIDDGARHPEGLFFLGASVDSEVNGQPSSDALGDDNEFLSDEDGVVLVGGALVPDSEGSLTVTASRHSAFLQGWIDYNNDGDFDDVIDGVSEQVVLNWLLNAGVNTVTFDIPLSVVGSTVYARFRYGEFGLGSTGLAIHGEVEDYALTVDTGTVAQDLIHGPDFDEDGDVDGADFLAWQRGQGTGNNATAAIGDANSDDAVDGDDLDLLIQDYGQGSPVSQVVAVTGDFDSDGDTDGADFLALQRGLGQTAVATLSSGDGNQDGDVDGADLQVWETIYGDSTGSSAFAAGQAESQFQSLAGFSSQHADISAAGPRAISPGFREDLVAGITDTAEVTRASLASIASEVERLAIHGRNTATPIARLENRVDEVHQARIAARADYRLASRDQGLDLIFAKRHKTLEELSDEHRGEAASEEAFALALGEEIDWRLG